MSLSGDIKDRSVLEAAALVRAILPACLFLYLPQTSAQEPAPPALTGVWSTPQTALEHPAWTIEELFACTCTSETYERITELLSPENDHLTAAEIRGEIRGLNRQNIAALFTPAAQEYAASFDHADDPAIQCEPFGAFRSMLHEDPIEIEQYADRIVIKGEDMASDRTIYLDGRGHPVTGTTTLTGHSIGWYEGSTLVIETVGVSANIAEDQLNIHNSDQARSIERYTRSADGSRLNMTFTFEDPVMFREPLTLHRTRLFTPEVPLEDLPCEAISGQL